MNRWLVSLALRPHTTIIGLESTHHYRLSTYSCHQRPFSSDHFEMCESDENTACLEASQGSKLYALMHCRCKYHAHVIDLVHSQNRLLKLSQEYHMHCTSVRVPNMHLIGCHSLSACLCHFCIDLPPPLRPERWGSRAADAPSCIGKLCVHKHK